MGILRLILAISVVIAHSDSFFGFKFTDFVVALEVFFMISGFYMAMILDKKYIGRGSYRLFLSNRFLRIYPMYWAVLLLTIFWSIISFFSLGNWVKLYPYIRYFDIMAFETLFFQLTANLVLFGQDIVMFLGMNPENGEMFFTSNFKNTQPRFWRFLLIPQAWSLAIEVMFYLIAPFIVRKSNPFIITVIITSLLIRMFTYFYLGYDNDPWTYRFFPSELALFLLGTISYRLHKSYLKAGFFNNKYRYLVVIIFFTILIFYQFIPFRSGYFSHVINWFFYFLTCASLPLIFELSKSSKYDARIGDLSYPIYISHILVIDCIYPFIKYFELQAYKGEFSVFLTIIFSYILVRKISDPIEKIRQSRVIIT